MYTIINFGILVGNVQTSVLAVMLKLAGPCCHNLRLVRAKELVQFDPEISSWQATKVRKFDQKIWHCKNLMGIS